jgi:hypothetical protein
MEYVAPLRSRKKVPLPAREVLVRGFLASASLSYVNLLAVRYLTFKPKGKGEVVAITESVSPREPVLDQAHASSAD